GVPERERGRGPGRRGGIPCGDGSATRGLWVRAGLARLPGPRGAATLHRMRFVALSLLLSMILPAAASAEALFLPREQEGAWLRADRQVHFAGSLAISASLRVQGSSKEEALVGTFAIGIAKE